MLSNLSRQDLSDEQSSLADMPKDLLMSKSQLDQATIITLQESQSAIAVAKKDINSFIESDYQIEYIKQIAGNLITVVGALTMLNHHDAKAVLLSCVDFVNTIIENGLKREDAESILATLADALIALEYYLSEIELHGVAPDNVLNVSKQSLVSLGFPVKNA